MMSSNEDPNDFSRSHIQFVKDTIIGHYRIIDKIGAGGMGEVYLAEDIELSRKVALKFLHPNLCQDADCRARFKREAQAAAQLNHPNIITIFEVSEYEGHLFFAMEHIEGKSLTGYIAEKNHSLADNIDLAIQICEGLSKAHQEGIVHRDIKPSNILIDRNGRAKILDFGLAAIKGDIRITKTGSTIGTIGYMSPEQSKREPIDERSDIFSFGVVFYEIITGQMPFRGEYEPAVIYSICCEEPEPLAKYKANIPGELQHIIDKALRKNLELRYQSTADLIADLKEIKGIIDFQTGQRPGPRVIIQPSIAVLPFHNLSADTEQEYFCDGMAEEIINALSHIDGLNVVARSSAHLFKDKSIDIREVGQRLGVNNVMEGSVRKSGSRVRITAQVIDVESGYHLWSEKFDREMEDIFKIQDEISLAIVEFLKVKLLAGEKDRLVKRHTGNPEAYNLYLKGRYFWNRRYEGGLQRGIEYFEQAIKKDPFYAPAYSGIADCYNQFGYFGYRPSREVYEKAKAAVAKALEIDDTLSEAHSCVGWIKTFYDWEWEAAEKAHLRALKLSPNSAQAHNWYGLFLALRGRTEESIREGDRSLELDPISLIFNAVRGLGYYWIRDYDKGIEQLKRTLEMDPEFSLAHLYLGFTYSGKQMWEEAVSSLNKFTALSMNSAVGVGHLGLVYGLSGQEIKAREILAQLKEMSVRRFVSPLYPALVLMGLKDNDRAFEYLYKAVEERESWMTTLKYIPFFESIRSDSRYPALVRQIDPSEVG